jgi:hypothetical protein
MKIIYALIFISLLPLAPVNSSELRGRISTNSASNQDQASGDESGVGGDDSQTSTIDEDLNNNPASGGSLFLNNQNQSSPKAGEAEKNQDIIALGINTYADGELLRGPDKRIYILQNGYRIYIQNLAELRKYAGKKIHDVSTEELAGYNLRKYASGRLIRQIGQAKVYEIKESGLKHILNLTELRQLYFGQEIFNISEEEMKLYS